MTKIEELKAAYAAATPGEWSTYAPCSGQDGFPDNYSIGCDTETRSTYVASVPGAAHYAWSQNNAHFITLAHNLMPQLLEAVDLLEILRYSMSQYDDGEWFLHDGGEDVVGKVDEFMEKLK